MIIGFLSSRSTNNKGQTNLFKKFQIRTKKPQTKQKSQLTRLVSGSDGVGCLAGIAGTCRVLRQDTELVLLSLHQPRDGGVGGCGGDVRALHPLFPLLLLFHDVARQLGAAVVGGSVPGQVHRVLGDLVHVGLGGGAGRD